MGCGCNKNKANGKVVKTASAARKAIYQVIDRQGQVLSEHQHPQEARKEATQNGGRIRITGKTVTNALP